MNVKKQVDFTLEWPLSISCGRTHIDPPRIITFFVSGAFLGVLDRARDLLGGRPLDADLLFDADRPLDVDRPFDAERRLLDADLFFAGLSDRFFGGLTRPRDRDRVRTALAGDF